MQRILWAIPTLFTRAMKIGTNALGVSVAINMILSHIVKNLSKKSPQKQPNIWPRNFLANKYELHWQQIISHQLHTNLSV